ncbi:MAG: hypothetical protein WCO08_03185 [Actinomycetes bacterium]
MIQRDLITWFEANKRDLPWRTTTPWGVLVSEFMLQQTPVNRVLPKWQEWMTRWPTPDLLASATKPEVIKAWDRLGYPRRALRLHETSMIISEKFQNQVPRRYEDLLALPGIGDYSAAAIAAFAFQQPSLVLDINIRRFFGRYFDGLELPNNSPSKIEREIRGALIPPVDGHVWAAATMEFGALICTSRKPKCEICPVKESCAWRRADFPVSEVKARKKFAGSDRQCRGNILRLLRQSHKVTMRELSDSWNDPEQLQRAIDSLVFDRLIQKKLNSQSYELAQ